MTDTLLHHAFTNEPRAASIAADAPVIQAGEGGSTPTAALDRHDWRVRPLCLDTAQELTRRFHYSRGGSNTAVYVLGIVPVLNIFDADAIAVSWWLPPTKTCGSSVWPDDPQAVLALSRLVCIPGAPKNSPSFLLAHAVRFIDQQRWPIWITFADEWQGHTGAIYRAAGWLECGRTKAERTYTLNGRMVCRKSGPKTRTHAEMMSIGCRYEGAFSRIRFVRVRPDLRERFKQLHPETEAA